MSYGYGVNHWLESWPDKPAVYSSQLAPSGHVDLCDICAEEEPYTVSISNGEGSGVSICPNCLKRMLTLFDEPEDMEEWEARVAAEKKKDEEFNARHAAREEKRRHERMARQ